MFRKMMLTGLTVLGMGLGLGAFGGNSASAHDGPFDRGGFDRRGQWDRGGWNGGGGGWDRGGWDRGGQWNRGVLFQVFYRIPSHCQPQVRLYGTFHNRWEAERAERMLEFRGFPAWVRVQQPSCGF